MSGKHRNHRGFTLIELITVIAILAILAAVAAVAYNKYAIERYDSEAMSHMTSLYEQASELVNEWGVDQVTAGCRDLGPDGVKDEASSASAEKLNNSATNSLNLKLTGNTHWRYKVCVGYVGNNESVLVSAHRKAGVDEGTGTTKHRVLVMGSSVPTPTIISEGRDGKDPDTPASGFTIIYDKKGSSGTALWKIGYTGL